jgi:uncharacterized protein (TIGR02246 family)
MKRAFALAVVLAAMSGLVLAHGADKKGNKDSGNVEQTILKLEQDWANALKTGDVAAIERIEADDYTFTDPEGKVSGKAEDIADLKSGDFKAQSMDLKDMKVRVLDDDAAVVTGVMDLKATQKGKDISGQYRFTDVFAKRNGRWQPVASQGTRIAAQQASASNK